MKPNRKQTIRFDDEIDQVNSDHIELGSSSAVTNNPQNGKQSFNKDLPTQQKQRPVETTNQVQQKPERKDMTKNEKETDDPNNNFYATFSKMKQEDPTVLVLNDYNHDEGVKFIGLGKIDQKLIFLNSNEKRGKKDDIQTPALNELNDSPAKPSIFGQKRQESKSFNPENTKSEALKL